MTVCPLDEVLPSDALLARCLHTHAAERLLERTALLLLVLERHALEQARQAAQTDRGVTVLSQPEGTRERGVLERALSAEVFLTVADLAVWQSLHS